MNVHLYTFERETDTETELVYLSKFQNQKLIVRREQTEQGKRGPLLSLGVA